ncbi:MAG: M3 family oligoendopeptidase [Proteobacteria bacterium]|nr:M3 family oligoendopeptidase [Pseudomonadota bacterium]MCP4917502.1 M3 family oligoendopeptidase [Pseudomonadota bacterium]
MAAPTWNLENLFTGGVESPDFDAALTVAEAEVEVLVTSADALPDLPEGLDDWAAWLLEADEFAKRAWQCATFSHCLTCADTNDRSASRAATRADAVFSRLGRAHVRPNDGIANASDEGFAALLARPDLEVMNAVLLRIRRDQNLLLPRVEEAITAELNEDGLAGWGKLYDRISGQLQVTIDGEAVAVTQASNMLGSTDSADRKKALAALDEAWKGEEEHCAQALSHIVGWRQTLNDRRGVDELADTLARNRLTRGTLDAMMESARRSQPILSRYMKAKAGLLGQDQLGWEDLAAPLPAPAAQQDWKTAESFILEHFHSYNPELADFAKMAFDGRWIEAEDRNGKRPGGWCANVPLSGESRIFMTFGGTFRSTVTLAHELGHAYHNWVTRDLEYSRRRITSTLAETASVFAESLVRDAALKAADSRQARLAMLDARLMAGASFLMNIPARYHFERGLYPLRRKGTFDPDELTELMLSCEKDAYANQLSTWYPRFWASKLHFFISGFAFYNYPYTFGYLFAQLVYRKVMAEGDHAAYVELLRRTGWDDAEPLALDTLGLDLESPDTWDLATAGLSEDLDAYITEVEGS